MNLLGKALTTALLACVVMWTVAAVRVAQAPSITPPDPVKEYAMNRLCQIGPAECVRLAHAAINAEKAQ